jgi:hypothetical protein
MYNGKNHKSRFLTYFNLLEIPGFDRLKPGRRSATGRIKNKNPRVRGV